MLFEFLDENRVEDGCPLGPADARIWHGIEVARAAFAPTRDKTIPGGNHSIEAGVSWKPWEVEGILRDRIRTPPVETRGAAAIGLSRVSKSNLVANATLQRKSFPFSDDS